MQIFFSRAFLITRAAAYPTLYSFNYYQHGPVLLADKRSSHCGKRNLSPVGIQVRGVLNRNIQSEMQVRVGLACLGYGGPMRLLFLGTEVLLHRYSCTLQYRCHYTKSNPIDDHSNISSKKLQKQNFKPLGHYTCMQCGTSHLQTVQENILSLII